MNVVSMMEKIQMLEAEVSRLQSLADRDDLTGCLRRKAFERLIAEKKKLGWLPRTCTVAIFDLDHFKSVNDTWGHPIGDQALVHVARLLEQHVPMGSLVCRMGGEEFVVVIPADQTDSIAALENLRIQIQNSPLSLTAGGPIHLQLTTSVGCAEWDSDSPILTPLAQADMALYRAKKGGRNQLAA